MVSLNKRKELREKEKELKEKEKELKEKEKREREKPRDKKILLIEEQIIDQHGDGDDYQDTDDHTVDCECTSGMKPPSKWFQSKLYNKVEYCGYDDQDVLDHQELLRDDRELINQMIYDNNNNDNNGYKIDSRGCSTQSFYQRLLERNRWVDDTMVDISIPISTSSTTQDILYHDIDQSTTTNHFNKRRLTSERSILDGIAKEIKRNITFERMKLNEGIKQPRKRRSRFNYQSDDDDDDYDSDQEERDNQRKEKERKLQEQRDILNSERQLKKDNYIINKVNNTNNINNYNKQRKEDEIEFEKERRDKEKEKEEKEREDKENDGKDEEDDYNNNDNEEDEEEKEIKLEKKRLGSTSSIINFNNQDSIIYPQFIKLNNVLPDDTVSTINTIPSIDGAWVMTTPCLKVVEKKIKVIDVIPVQVKKKGKKKSVTKYKKVKRKEIVNEEVPIDTSKDYLVCTSIPIGNKLTNAMRRDRALHSSAREIILDSTSLNSSNMVQSPCSYWIGTASKLTDFGGSTLKNIIKVGLYSTELLITTLNQNDNNDNDQQLNNNNNNNDNDIDNQPIIKKVKKQQEECYTPNIRELKKEVRRSNKKLKIENAKVERELVLDKQFIPPSLFNSKAIEGLIKEMDATPLAETVSTVRDSLVDWLRPIIIEMVTSMSSNIQMINVDRVEGILQVTNSLPFKGWKPTNNYLNLYHMSSSNITNSKDESIDLNLIQQNKLKRIQIDKDQQKKQLNNNNNNNNNNNGSDSSSNSSESDCSDSSDSDSSGSSDSSNSSSDDSESDDSSSELDTDEDKMIEEDQNGNDIVMEERNGAEEEKEKEVEDQSSSSSSDDDDEKEEEEKEDNNEQVELPRVVGEEEVVGEMEDKKDDKSIVKTRSMTKRESLSPSPPVSSPTPTTKSKKQSSKPTTPIPSPSITPTKTKQSSKPSTPTSNSKKKQQSKKESSSDSSCSDEEPIKNRKKKVIKKPITPDSSSDSSSSSSSSSDDDEESTLKRKKKKSSNILNKRIKR